MDAPGWSAIEPQRFTEAVSARAAVAMVALLACQIAQAAPKTPGSRPGRAVPHSLAKIAFVSTRGSRAGTNNIYVAFLRLTGVTVKRITNHPDGASSPSWSPDGRRMAFWSDRDDEDEGGIYTMKAGGTDVQCLTTYAGVDMSPCWSPKGNRIA